LRRRPTQKHATGDADRRAQRGDAGVRQDLASSMIPLRRALGALRGALWLL
jgi:hypothetical protein